MPIISYAEFDRLRLREFAADDAAYGEDLEEHGIAILETIRGVSFARPRGRPEQLHSVGVEFKYASPEVAGAVLQRFGLRILPFDSLANVEHHLGAPQRRETWPPDYQVAFFEVGDADRYSLRCGFGNDDRLDVIGFQRLDFPMDMSEFA